jgi:hypothetical protein
MIQQDKGRVTMTQEDWRIRLATSVARGKGITLSREETRAAYEQFNGDLAAMLLRVLHQIAEVAEETRVDAAARFYQIKVWTEKAIKVSQGKQPPAGNETIELRRAIVGLLKGGRTKHDP